MDTGILNNAFHVNGPHAEVLVATLNTYLAPLGNQAFFVATPISLIEFCGLPRPTLAGDVAQTCHGMLSERRPLEQRIADTLANLREEVGRIQNWGYPDLLARFEQQLTFRVPQSHPLINSIFRHNLENQNTRMRFEYEFAIDLFQQINFRTVPNLDVNELWAQMSQFILHPQFNVSLARLFSQLAEPQQNGPVHRPDAFAAGQDFDTQIVHFCTCGYKENQQMLDTHAFTTERLQGFRERCEGYGVHLSALMNTIPGFRTIQGAINKIRNGEIEDRLEIEIPHL